MRVSLTIICIAFIACSFSQATYARNDVPIPEKKANLNDINRQLDQSKAQEKELKNKVDSAKKDIKKTKQSLIKLADSIQDKEKNLSELESKIKTLEDEKSDIISRLEKDYGSISDLILAIERIERVPTQALIARPGAPHKTAQSALLLKSIIPGLKARADILKEDLDKLNSIEETLIQEKKNLDEGLLKLDREHNKIASLLTKRETIYKQTNKEYKQQKQAVEQIANEAKTLKELIDKVEKENAKRKASLTSQKRNRRALLTNPVSMPRAGTPRYPINGVLLTAYGELDEIGAVSKGLTIEGRQNALVMSPMGGIVRFAGFFKTHGKIVIIEHKNGYHSLIAGLGKIDTIVGQSVEAGEPIGLMPALQNGQPQLYYELRQKGKPINPTKKFSELS
jgi:septal ring factor EnvC (AmiA/AmiB activator)